MTWLQRKILAGDLPLGSGSDELVPERLVIHCPIHLFTQQHVCLSRVYKYKIPIPTTRYGNQYSKFCVHSLTIWRVLNILYGINSMPTHYIQSRLVGVHTTYISYLTKDLLATISAWLSFSLQPAHEVSTSCTSIITLKEDSACPTSLHVLQS